MMRFIVCLLFALCLFQVQLAAAQNEVVPVEEAVAPVDEAAPAAEVAEPVETPEPVADEPMEPEEAVESTQTIFGQVVKVDAATSTITVQYLDDEEAETYQTLELKVSDAAEILKAEEAVALADVKEQQWVTVEYQVDTAGNNVAESILVEE